MANSQKINEVIKMGEIESIKFVLEVCNQEGFKNPSAFVKEYNIEFLGC